MSEMNEHVDLILDGTKVAWHKERINDWKNGMRIAPITIDMALTRACNYACHFCYAMLQENDRKKITSEVMDDFLEDCKEIGVKGISFVSDGESTISPHFMHSCKKGHELGLSMAVGTNGFVLTKRKLEELLPTLTYLRINISAGERDRYAEIMGTKPEYFDRVCENIREMVSIKKERNLDVTIGMQMVLMPEYEDQILPLANLGKELRPDYLVIKHCSDNEDGDLGVDYSAYEALKNKLREAEALSDQEYKCIVKWSKINANGARTYKQCYGAPFILQMSGSGLIAPCGMLFNEKYKKFHIGNICENRFKDIWNSDRYWQVMNHLSGPNFNAQRMCGSLCLQHKTNEFLDKFVQNSFPDEMLNVSKEPAHVNFI